MNSAEAARRRNKFMKEKEIPIPSVLGNPWKYLQISLQYQQEVEELKKELEKSQ